MFKQERLDLLKEIINKFRTGHDIDWNNVETAFDIAFDLVEEYNVHMLRNS